MSDRLKLTHLVVGFLSCLGLVLLAYASKHWELGTTTQAAVGGFLGLVLWQVRSVLFRSTPPASELLKLADQIDADAADGIYNVSDRIRAIVPAASAAPPTKPRPPTGPATLALIVLGFFAIPPIFSVFGASAARPIDDEAFIASAGGCSPAVRSAIIQGTEDIGKCVLQQATSGANPAAILASCAGSTFDDIIKIIEAFLVGHPGADPASSPDAKQQYVELHRLLMATKAAAHGAQP